MSYEIEFKESALKEWRKLGATVRDEFKAKLKERVKNPRYQPAKLHGLKDCYKIKLRGKGYRLIYEVQDAKLIIVVLKIGRRDESGLYNLN